MKIDILGVSELRWKGAGHFQSEGCSVYYSGNDDTGRNGVAFVVTREVSASIIGYNPVNDRIISLRMESHPVCLTIIQVYAPTTGAEEEDIEEFYQVLQDVIEGVPKKDVLFLIGDWNAKVGKKETKGITGKFGLGKRNEAGERLVEFCNDNDLFIANTYFEQHKRRLFTWTSPNGQYKNQIDYIIGKKRWKSSIRSAKTFPGADCGTDHELLVGCIQIRLKKNKREAVPCRYDLENIQENYKSEVRDRFGRMDLENKGPEEIWTEVKNIIGQAAMDLVPKTKKKEKNRWISKQAIDIAEKRKVMKIRGRKSEMKELNAEFQKQVRKDKEDYLAKECSSIEESNRLGRTRDLFKKIKEITGKFTPRMGVIRSKEGTTLTEVEEIRQRWREYTENLYKKNPRMEVCFEDKEIEEEPPVIESEVEWALNTIANRKAPGTDGLPIELFKEIGEGIRVLTALCQKIWSEVRWPEEWKRCIYVPIPKKGNAKECENYRTISLISHASKIMLKIIQKRMESYLERELPEEQAGFRKNRGTRDQIANIRWILEKGREFQNEIFLCFIDYSKAFDCVDHSRLWNVLRYMGLPEHLIQLIKELYTHQQASVRTEAGNTDWFDIGKGVRQGCVLSPYLFNLYSEYIMRMTGLEDDKVGIKIGGRIVNNLRYADDTTLLAGSREDLCHLIERVKLESAKAGLKLNVRKTKILTTSDMENIKIDGEEVESVDSFVFLGSLINKDGYCMEEIRRRISMGKTAMKGLMKIMKDREIKISTKIRLVNALVFPVVTYGSESWTIRKKERKKIDAFEMWVWRRLLRIPWTAKRTNRSVLDEIKPGISLEARIVKHRLTFFGHVMRANGLEKALMLGKTEGRRKRGRQRMRWLDGVKEATAKGLQEVKDMIENRNGWRTFVQKVTRSRKRLDGT